MKRFIKIEIDETFNKSLIKIDYFFVKIYYI